ncbi:MAG: hypothetical protein QM657_11880 [Lacrimispora sp.]|uniref:hypothetical protein n=1 Tax=Lacrimispora sp. TaxID=2719234 RepID=UPI0039E6D3D5
MNNFLNREWSSCDYKLITIIAFLSGIIIGFMFSPVKKGIYCGNHNGNTQTTEKDI